MKAIAVALGAALAAAAPGAFAQFENRPEPWDDIRNGAGWGENRWNWDDEKRFEHRHDHPARHWRGVPHECWNWRANTWEMARPDEIQDDLDYGRCRPAGYAYRGEVPRYRYYYR